MSSDPSDKICLTTALTEDFLPGALAMLHSFVRQNPWFGGDIVIFHNGLSAGAIADLTHVAPRVRAQEISEKTRASVAAAVARRPDLSKRQAAFYKAELLRLEGYDRLICADSDMIFTGSVGQLLQRPDTLQATADGSAYRGIPLSRDNYLPAEPGEAVLEQSFSTAFMVFGPQSRSRALYDAYIAEMQGFDANRRTSGHTDQAILNVLFDGQVTRLSPVYNYHLMHRALIGKVTGVAMAEAAILHFGGWWKPWVPADALKVLTQDPEMKWPLDQWRAAYRETRAHLAKAKEAGRP